MGEEQINKMEAILMKKAMKEMLDQEWIELMLCAKQMGLTIVEIQLFLRNSSKIKTNEDLNLNHDLPETKAL